jgi:hypothetical protein
MQGFFYIGPRGGIFHPLHGCLPPLFKVCMLHIHVHKLTKQPTFMIFQSNPTTLGGLERAFRSIFPLFGKFLERNPCIMGYEHERQISCTQVPTKRVSQEARVASWKCPPPPSQAIKNLRTKLVSTPKELCCLTFLSAFPLKQR